ncbi:MAG: HAD-IIB family hydrolase [Coprobacillaceae bacterium]
MKVIGCDFDGTLLPKGIGKISNITRQLISNLKKQGSIFIIVTGRSPTQFKKAIFRYNVDFFDYVICSNGAATYDSNMCLLEYHALNTEIVQEIQALVSKKEKGLLCTLHKDVRLSNVKENTLEDQIISLNFSSSIILNKFPIEIFDKASIFCNGKYIDIIKKDVSKATTLLTLNRKLQGDSLYVIGDDKNDMLMFKITKNSYSFSFVDKEIQSEATYIRQTMEEILEEIIDK